ncbi:MAG: valine--tRNA ligase [Solirubrobacteraceae bacterium]
MSRRSLSDLESRTRFEPAELEALIGAAWLESGLLHPEPEGAAADNYSIAIPPPNVTGALHMGHALNGSIQDTLVRYERMCGRRVKWILGTDHAGIATQTQVEKTLRAEGTSREELGRERFVQRVWDWREEHGGTIVEQLKRLGATCDYEAERFTLDDGYAEAVARVFVRLFERGYIYRDNYMVNWDPGSGSAISDLEVEDREVEDTLYSVAYPLADGQGELVVATVRPETMLADTAVAVHPDDQRYKHLIGREVVLPLIGRHLPIIADAYVKPEFGTGALKITPGHDPNDFEIGRRHGLPELTVIGEDGRMSAAGYEGATVADARRAIVDSLAQQGLLRAQRSYMHVVPFSHRSGARIEPLISLQWFMRMDELAQPAIDAVSQERVRFHPDRWGRVYLDWMENIRPWCISRQLWWGHRLPVYYCDACEETYVALEPPARCGACNGELRRDEDVLDTWFSSALWPFATLGWPDQTPELAAFYPTDALVTAREIIFLWVARMIMMGLEFTGEVPFSDVYVTSVIQAPDGRKMSKSLGNGIDPLEEIDRHGADAVRFGMLAMSSAQDVRYSREKIAQGESLANKLWNASRLILLRVDPHLVPAARPTELEDRWILSRLTRVEREITARIERFDLSHAALALYDFIYSELCDWYLEMVKARLSEPDEELSATLLWILRRTLALGHPLLPYVTEELWSYVRLEGEGLLLAGAYPVADERWLDGAAEATMATTIAAVQTVRAWRNEVGIAPGVRVPARIAAPGAERNLLARLARLELAGGGENHEQPVASLAVPGGLIEMLEGEGVDMQAHEQRRSKQRERLEQDLRRARDKLADSAFVSRAPAAVVDAERVKLARLEGELAAL